MTTPNRVTNSEIYGAAVELDHRLRIMETAQQHNKHMNDNHKPTTVADALKQPWPNASSCEQLAQTAPPNMLIEQCRFLRKSLRQIGETVVATRQDSHRLISPEAYGRSDFGEIQANLTLAFCHIEDAAMRLGKAIQAADGGASCYDK